jgi:hypothetical protein
MAYARRDCEFLLQQARQHGPAVERFATELLAVPLPWTRMRRVYALLGLCRRYGSQRVDEACTKALAAEMCDVRRLQRMLERGQVPQLAGPPPRAKVTAVARYLRAKEQYALPRPAARRNDEEEP